MRRGPAIVLAAILAVPVLSAQGLGVTAAVFRQAVADHWAARLGESPELATHLGVSTYDRRWRDWSAAGRDRSRAMRREFLQRLVYIATGNLSYAERLSADLLMDDLRAELDPEPWLLLVRRVSPYHGAHNEVFDAIGQMPARTLADYENILARIHALPAYVDHHIGLMREQLAAGIAQPASTIDRILEQVAAQHAAPADSSPLLAGFRQFPPAIAVADQERLRRDAVASYEGPFRSSWRALDTFLREMYRPNARPAIAIASLPGGAAAYRQLLRSYTGSTLTPEAIHELGLEEVARIEREMTRIAREAGFEGSPLEFERQLAARPGVRLGSGEEVLAYARDVLARLETGMPRLLRVLPRSLVGVRLAPAQQGPAMGSTYMAGTADGSRPAWFTIDPAQVDAQVTYRLEPLVLHGTVPGYHAHVGVARELAGVPAFRRALDVPAFSHGWAIYAESLGTEIPGLYRDPETRFGKLVRERLQAMALVVDTGIHALGWPRARAEAYFAEHAPDDALAIERYIASPAEAMAAKIGELKIREERRRAERELGPWFDVRDFHDVVLRNGAVPLDVLEEQVTRYIAAAKASVP